MCMKYLKEIDIEDCPASWNVLFTIERIFAPHIYNEYVKDEINAKLAYILDRWTQHTYHLLLNYKLFKPDYRRYKKEHIKNKKLKYKDFIDFNVVINKLKTLLNIDLKYQNVTEEEYTIINQWLDKILDYLNNTTELESKTEKNDEIFRGVYIKKSMISG